MVFPQLGSSYIVIVLLTTLEIVMNLTFNDTAVSKRYRRPANLSEVDLVTGLTTGALGNQLCAFASLYALQQEFGPVAVHHQHCAWMICFYFQCNEQVLTMEKLLPESKRFSWVYYTGVPSPLEIVPNPPAPNSGSGRKLTIGGDVYGINHYYKFMPELKRKFLTFKDEFKFAAKRRIEGAKLGYLRTHTMQDADPITVVGIHSRTGDYQSMVPDESFAGTTYFTRAMDMFRKTVKHVIFIILSHDMEWAKKNIVPVNDDCFFNGDEDEKSSPTPPLTGPTGVVSVSPEIGTDLAILSQADHLILTCGTFGLWGALLGQPGRRILFPAEYKDMIILDMIPPMNITGWDFV